MFDRVGFATPLLEANMIFTVFCILLYIAVHLQHNKVLYRVIALVPLSCCIIFGVVQQYSQDWLTARLSLLSFFNFLFLDNYSEMSTFFTITITGLTILCALMALYLCFIKEKLNGSFCILLVLLGLGSGIIMGFSPTVWMSGARTLIYMYFMFFACIILIYNKLRLLNFKQEPVIFTALCFSAVYSYVGYIASLVVLRR